jgi:hypothetical protein
VLCCAVLCCAVLCCAVLCCAVLCCAVLCCAVLCCAMTSSVVLCVAQPLTTDYLFVSPDVRVRTCELGATSAKATDPTIYASDHFAVVADLELS